MFPSFPDPQTELAKERNRIAADRTLLSWIRITVSFIGIGFGIDQILGTLDSLSTAKLVSSLNIRVLGLFFIGLGILTSLFAILDYQGELRRLLHSEYRYTSRLSVGMSIAGALVILSIMGLIFLVTALPSRA